MRGRALVTMASMAMLLMAPAAGAQSASEQRAAKETYIDGLRLLEGAERDARLAALGVHLGYVEQDTSPGGGKYFCGAMARDAASQAGRTIAAALARLPDASLAKLRLRYVILCSRALASGQRIGGIPVPPLDLLMLDVGDSGGAGAHLQYGFLHELYHLIEFRFNTYQDPEWQRLFGAGYASSYAGRMSGSTLGGAKPGFLNAYAETFPHEERAELFAALVLTPAEVVAHAKARDDELLRRKIVYMVDKCQRLIGLRISLP